MKILFRLIPAVVALACVLPAPRPLAAQASEPGDGFFSRWDVLVRPRTGYFLPRWNGADGLRLARRPTVGLELMLRPNFSWYGARVLLERTGQWQGLGPPGLTGRLGTQPERFESVLANLVLFPVRDQQVMPYFFAGGGFKAVAPEGSGTSLFFPLAFGRFERRPAMHAGIGFDAMVNKFLFTVEVGDYYGDVLDYGKVHDLHVSFLVAYTDFGGLFKALKQERTEELEPPDLNRR